MAVLGVSIRSAAAGQCAPAAQVVAADYLQVPAVAAALPTRSLMLVEADMSQRHEHPEPLPRHIKYSHFTLLLLKAWERSGPNPA